MGERWREKGKESEKGKGRAPFLLRKGAAQEEERGVKRARVLGFIRLARREI